MNREVGGSIANGNRSVAATQMGDDESRVGDRIFRKGGCVLTGYRGAQSLGCLADGKRERLVLLNVPEM